MYLQADRYIVDSQHVGSEVGDVGPSSRAKRPEARGSSFLGPAAHPGGPGRNIENDVRSLSSRFPPADWQDWLHLWALGNLDFDLIDKPW